MNDSANDTKIDNNVPPLPQNNNPSQSQGRLNRYLSEHPFDKKTKSQNGSSQNSLPQNDLPQNNLNKPPLNTPPLNKPPLNTPPLNKPPLNTPQINPAEEKSKYASVEKGLFQGAFNSVLSAVGLKRYDLPADCKKIVESDDFSDKICLFVRDWNIRDCMKDPKTMFVFGDNNVGYGMGGQAIVRKCPNAKGIPTKKNPDNRKSSFYTDAEYDRNCEHIMNALTAIIRASPKYDQINLPVNGFGTGLARLPQTAPKTHAFLEEQLNKYFGVDYVDLRKNGLELHYDISKKSDEPKSNKKAEPKSNFITDSLADTIDKHLSGEEGLPLCD